MISGVRAMRFVPLVAAIAYETQRLLRAKKWSWSEELPELLLVSLATSFYSYGYDEILAIPALMLAYLRGERRVFLGIFVLTNAAIFVYLRHWLPIRNYMFLSWTGLAWMVLYWLPRALAHHMRHGPTASGSQITASG